MIHIEVDPELALFLAILVALHCDDLWVRNTGKDQDILDLAEGIGNIAQGLYDVAGGAGAWRVYND